ncbi:ABC transporter substrate-binding protein [Bacillus sp. AFS076308]|uniref:ABC transporter substrate-binding protein n=1 Tax=unclassified Bacillus (in: firmicutes) TaxID=185979 RepID=UPI000BFA0EBD|nr:MULTISPECIES: ABC transporter substrate-binding protein [unclassified Bacillus (in: firmicutes)]PFO06663.1 ABC transporter substrate-binding protein [Bacillus sp. AFS076308]PGV52784.1 ABC transporter substrate-binding protein [Bacillus sp. AFS037270]
MKKWYSLLLVVLLTIGLLAGCAGTTKPNEEGNQAKTENTTAAFPVTIKDALGNKVVMKQKPEKIVSLMPSNTEIAYALGLGKEIVGVSDYDNYPKDTLKKEKIGGQQFNTEKIIGLKPNLVLAHASSASIAKDALQQIRDAGIPVLVIANAQNFEQVYSSIEMIGKATGETKKADEIVKGMKDKLAAIKAKAASIKEKKKVYMEVSPAPDIYTTGKNTFMDEMLTTIHANNVVNDQQGWIKVDQEAIIQKNPDVIITTYGYYVKNTAQQVLSRKGWENVNAVKNKQVIDINSDLVDRPGPRVVEGVEELAKEIYPDVFK